MKASLSAVEKVSEALFAMPFGWMALRNKSDCKAQKLSSCYLMSKLSMDNIIVLQDLISGCCANRT